MLCDASTATGDRGSLVAMRTWIQTALVASLAFPIGAGYATAAEPADRRVAVTFDDLPGPAGSLLANDVAALRENTRKLLATFAELRMPVVGFVNEGKLFVDGEKPEHAEARIAVLKTWIDAGYELGNHTYSHRSLNRTPLEEFQADVIRGEPVTRGLLEAKGMKLRYFRHPFLQVGLEIETRRAFEAFLKGRGYTIAPVTIDNDEYVYAAIYADALRRGDQETATKIGADYGRYMEAVIAFVEDVSRRLVGRDIPHVLLLHANALNADYFGAVARSMKERGYRFVPLDEVLRDVVYGMPDTYVGNWGISWLHHWELAAGKKRSPSPDPPEWVTKAYEALAR
jgi:peptidoglycan/xylan/chitin deacetylase (PgdA/CDA1 family)